jgi:hypothetical protein
MQVTTHGRSSSIRGGERQPGGRACCIIGLMRQKRTLGALVAAVAVGLGVPAEAAPPSRGVFVPGISLGGVELGMTKREVLRAWGPRHGVCRGCPHATWYFNYRRFEPQGAGVVFRRGRVAHVFTLWQPDGWRTVDGLALGSDEREVGEALVVLDERACKGYTAVLASGPSALSVFYVYRERIWGFGLIRPGRDPCL